VGSSLVVGSLDVAAGSRALHLHSHPEHQPLAVGIVDSKSISNGPEEVFNSSASHNLRRHQVDL